MNQVRLNHLIALHVYKALTDTIKLENITDEFVSSSQRYLAILDNDTESPLILKELES